MPASSRIKPEEREFAGAPMHMLSKRDSISAELETVRASRRPTTVITSNASIETNEEATVLRPRPGFIRDRAAPRRYYEWFEGQKKQMLLNLAE